ncbi:unnamed protein product [Rotaria socialis]|uniref:Uncharacterized protein n=1 Tax=Rotaria socialis TaxID=392032 RepID=A0A820LBI8_9BILA|nr:unnamed protein product [Rotaria socialis]
MISPVALELINIENNNLETLFLLWLDTSVNSTTENIDVQQSRRISINHLKVFEYIEQCKICIEFVSVHDQVVLIVSGQFGREIVPRIHSLWQLYSVYHFQFVHSQLLIDCLITMKSTAVVKGELIGTWKKEHEGNAAPLNIIHEFEPD